MPAAMSDDWCREQCLRRLHKLGYPANASALKMFNKTLYKTLGPRARQSKTVPLIINKLHQSIRNGVLPKSIEDNFKLTEMFYDVAADYAKKWSTGEQPEKKETPAKRTRDLSTTTIILDDADDGDDDVEERDIKPLITNHPPEADVDMADNVAGSTELEELAERLIEEKKKNGEMVEKMAEQRETIIKLENRNEELIETLKMKEGECQQLEEEMARMKEVVQLRESSIAKMEHEMNIMQKQLSMGQTASQGQDNQTSDDQKRILEHTVHILKGDKRALEEKTHALEEIVRVKDHMLETFLQMQQTLHSFINMQTPQ